MWRRVAALAVFFAALAYLGVLWGGRMETSVLAAVGGWLLSSMVVIWLQRRQV